MQSPKRTESSISASTYDALGRQAQRLYPDGTRITWTYDAVANPLTIDASYGRFTRIYSPRNLVKNLVWPTGDSFTWTYDAAQQRRTRVDSAGDIATYTYDSRGEVRQIINERSEITTLTYDGMKREIRKNLDNGTRSVTTYDDLGRITAVTNLEPDDSVIFTGNYVYDKNGNRTENTVAYGTSNTLNDEYTWKYDETNQIVFENSKGNFNDTATTYTYDPAGNRLVQIKDGDLTTYTYNAANQQRNLEDDLGITTFTYDADGNKTSAEKPSGDLTTFTWTYENQLATFIDANDVVTSYAYAPINRKASEQRVMKETEVEGETHFVWDSENIIRELDELSTVEAEYTLNPKPYGNLVSQHRDSDTSYFHFDALGSTRALTDSTAATTDEYEYAAFGKLVGSTGSTINPFGWVGQLGYYLDEESGQYSVRKRQYEADLGQWMSDDPIGLAGGDFNLQRYVENNPTNHVDPSGLDKLTVIGNDVYWDVERDECKYKVYIGKHNPDKGSVTFDNGPCEGGTPTSWKPTFACGCEVNLATLKGMIGLVGKRGILSLPKGAYCPREDESGEEAIKRIKGNMYARVLTLACAGQKLPNEEDCSVNYTNIVCDALDSVFPGACSLLDRVGKCADNASEFEEFLYDVAKKTLFDRSFFKKFAKYLNEQMSCAISMIKDDIAGFLGDGLEKILDLDFDIQKVLAGDFQEILRAVGLSSGDIYQWAWEVGGDAYKDATWVIDAAAGIISSVLEAVLSGKNPNDIVKQITEQYGNQIKDIIDEAFSVFNEWKDNLGGKLTELIKKEVPAILLNFFQSLATKPYDIFNQMLEKCNDFKDLISRMKEAIECFENPQSKKCSESEFCKRLFETLKAMVAPLLSGAIAVLGGRKALEKLKEAICKLKCGIEAEIKGLLCKLMKKIKKHVPKPPKNPDCPNGNCGILPPCESDDEGPVVKPKPGTCDFKSSCTTACRKGFKGKSGNCFSSDTLVHQSSGHLLISEVEIGQRVITYTDSERTRSAPGELTDIDYARYRLIDFTVPCEEGQRIHVQLLRSETWLVEKCIEVGTTVFLDMMDMGIEGDALVESVQPCPEIEPGFGRIVMGTFHHSQGELREIWIDSDSKPIRTTANHPFWSVEKNDWVHAAELEVGMQLKTLERISTIEKIGDHSSLEPVYNIEVQGDHVYRVGTSGVLVHNTSPNRCDWCLHLSTGGHPVSGDPPKKNYSAFIRNNCPPKGEGKDATGLTFEEACKKFNGYVHGHHIVEKVGKHEKKKTEEARNILCKFDIDPYTSCLNLAFAPNTNHTPGYEKAVYETLKAFNKNRKRPSKSKMKSEQDALAIKLRELAKRFQLEASKNPNPGSYLKACDEFLK